MEGGQFRRLGLVLTTLMFINLAWTSPVPIPTRPHGIVYNQASVSADADANPVVLEVFMELACRDVQRAFPVLLQVADHYEDLVKLIMYQFPLPYHRAALYGSQSLRIITDISPGSEVTFISHVLDNQFMIRDSNLTDKTDVQLIQIFADFAVHCGIDQELFLSKMNDKYGRWPAITEWKYGCSRAVSGTPFVFVNGVYLTNNSSITLEQYIHVLDPLVHAV